MDVKHLLMPRNMPTSVRSHIENRRSSHVVTPPPPPISTCGSAHGLPQGAPQSTPRGQVDQTAARPLKAPDRFAKSHRRTTGTGIPRGTDACGIEPAGASAANEHHGIDHG